MLDRHGSPGPEERNPFLHFAGMVWPNPDDPLEVQHALRYGEPTREQRLVAASFMAAYGELVDLPGRTRDARVAAIRKGRHAR